MCLFWKLGWVVVEGFNKEVHLVGGVFFSGGIVVLVQMTKYSWASD